MRHWHLHLIIFGLVVLSSACLQGQTPVASAAMATKVIKKWPAEVVKVEIPCSDGAIQPAMWYAPSSEAKKPLLVGLHTWSSSYASTGGDVVYAEWCIAQGWAFVHPDFRGPNWTPLALGSDRAVQDIVEAVAWAKKETQVDESRIYLIGVSGGGHMSLLMAGRHPELWAGVSAWCGIADIAQWHKEHQKNGRSDNYARHIEAALGHAPAPDDAEARQRSPLTHLKGAVGVPLEISHGILDGRQGSVPFHHALHAFNAVVSPGDRLSEADIHAYYATQKLPAGWPAAAEDATYAPLTTVFRKTSHNTRVTLFGGGHEIIHQAALNWLAKQRQGQPAVWEVGDFIKVEHAASNSGK